MSALEIFREIPQTKADIKVCVKNAKEEMLSGDYNPLEIDLHLKRMEEIVKALREDKEVKSAVLTELEKYTEKTVNAYGCEITKVSRAAWQYDLCNDLELREMEEQKRVLDEKIKAKQKELQFMTTEKVVVTLDGEITTIYPASKTYTDTFSIKIL